MKLYHTLELAKNYFTKDIDKCLEELSNFIFVVNYLNNSLYDGKVQIKPWQCHLALFLFKLTQHTGSIVDTVKGKDRRSHIKNKKANYPDLVSTYVLARAAMETYLMNYYLNFDSQNEDQCVFRSKLFEMSGLFRRQSFAVSEDYGGEQIKKEKIKVEELKKEISLNKYFLSLDVKRQKKLLQGTEAKELSYDEILKNRGITNEQTITLWRLYSNFAHSEYISVIQLRDYINDSKITKDSLVSIIGEMVLLLSLQIIDLINKFHSAQIAYNSLDKTLHTKVEIRIEMTKKHFQMK